MTLDRNSRPLLHRIGLTLWEASQLTQIARAAALDRFVVTLRALTDQATGPVYLDIDESDRLPIWQAVPAGPLRDKFLDYDLDWRRIGPAIIDIMDRDLVDEDFWILNRSRYGIPGGIEGIRGTAGAGHFYLEARYATNGPGAELNHSLFARLGTYDLGVRRYNAKCAMFDWHQEMWVHHHRPHPERPRAPPVVPADQANLKDLTFGV